MIHQPLFQVFPQNQCVDVFADYIFAKRDFAMRESIQNIQNQKQRRSFMRETIAKIIESPSWQENMIYRPQKADVIFYLPYAYVDLVQGTILITDDYYERESLDYCFDRYHDGVIGRSICGKTIIDVGANIGNHSLYFAKQTSARKVISFEPVDETFEILKKNVVLNHLEKKIQIINCGLGEKISRAAVQSYYYDNLGGTAISPSMEGDIAVKRLDDFQIPGEIGFMKIDVEGMELSVLQGAMETIKKNHPYIFLEAFAREDAAEKNEGVCDLLAKLDYQWERVDEANILFM